MDNVSSIEFKYEIIRQQKKQSKNIFEFAANLSIIQNNNLFLQVEDICIIDYINYLYITQIMTYLNLCLLILMIKY